MSFSQHDFSRGELRHPAPDLQNDDLGELLDVIKYMIKHDDVTALSGEGQARHSPVHEWWPVASRHVRSET